jgi:23S rRNA pseudouridine1911/1915/1917 synthase
MLNQFLADQLGASKTKIKQLLDQRTVFVNRQRVWIATFRLQPGDIVEAIEQQQAQTYAVLFEDDYFLVVNKPAGIVTNGDHSLETKLQKKYPTVHAIHRLDKDTSGVILFAKSRDIFEKMKILFMHKEITKEYDALVQGQVLKNVTSNSPINGESATSHIHVVQRYELYTHVRVDIETGRTHQIRIHCARLGHPVLGEKQYVMRELQQSLYRQVPRQMLHASKIGFQHPITGETMQFSAPLPDDFKKYI